LILRDDFAEEKEDNEKEKPCRRKVYKFCETFDTKEDLDKYLRSKVKLGYKVNKNNGQVGCTACKNQIGSRHKMEQNYLICNCGVCLVKSQK
jgi:hypothetical protein